MQLLSVVSAADPR